MIQELSATLLRPLAWVIGLAVAGGASAGLAAAAYRWYARDRLPEGLAVLLSLGVVALYLNTTEALQAVVGGEGDVFDLAVVVTNVATLAAAALAAPVGTRAGDRVGTAMATVSGARELEDGASQLLRSVGRVVTVELPAEVGDMDAYDPVPPAVKASLAGATFVFPRRLTVAQLRERLVQRLRDDYDVGHVDVDLAADGTVEYLAVGSRAAGLGPTLPPGTVAVAVRADPARAASAGDHVEVWRPGDPPERVLTAELRGTAGDVATLAVDESEVAELDDSTRYRLVTLPAAPRAGNEFAALLRAADETMGVATLAEDSDYVGATVGDLPVTAVAIRSDDGEVVAPPPRDRALAAGDTVYAIGRPATQRRFEAAARGDGGDREAPDPATD